MIKVVLADDQNIIIQGLKMIMNLEEDISVIGTAINGKEVMEIIKMEEPNVVVLDIKMPIMNGVEATREITKNYPNIKILILTTFLDDEYIYEAIKEGAVGYLLKDSPPQKIIEAIRIINEGGSLMSPTVTNRLISKIKSADYSTVVAIDENLTDREIDILKLIGNGYSNKEISIELFLTEGTVKNHITKILTKLDLRDRTQLAIYAIKTGLS